MAEYLRMARLDPEATVARIREAGGPDLTVVGALTGGSVGAAVVRAANGHESVLKVIPPPMTGPGSPDLATVIALTDAARAVGVPAPAYEAQFELDDGAVAVMQERVVGVLPVHMSDALVERVVELARVRVGAVPVSLRGAPSPLFLLDDGPGFCLHATLRQHDARTRDLIARIETVGERCDSAPGDDIVHFDYHPENMLVAPDDPERIVAIVDWTGARAGSIGLDFVILAFALGWWSDRLSNAIAEEARLLVGDTRFLAIWAHAALRLVDWSIRHFPEHVDHWVNFSNRKL